MESATIQITGNYDSTEDVLDFTDTGLISGSWSSGSGTLTLSGRASVADYQAALRAVSYQNTDGASPNLSARTISFSASDAFYTSSLATRDIYVTQTLTDLSTNISNTVFHFDAQDIDGDLLTNDQPSNGSSVSAWGDRSENARESSATVTNSAPSGDEPLFNSNYFGERGALFFNYNSGNNGDNSLMNNGGPYSEKSFATVFRTGTDLTGLQILFEQGGNGNGYQISIKDGNLYAYTWSGNGEWVDGEDQSVNLGSVQTNTSYIVIATHDASSTSWEANVNGATILQSSGAAGTMNNHGGDATIGEEDGTRDPVTFAGNPGGTNNFDGYIAELVSWNTALNVGRVASVYNFLCDKWCNTPSVFTSIEGTNLDFTEKDSPIAITSSIAISDVDNTLLDSAKVSITANYLSSEDELAFVDAGGITGSWNSATGVLFLSGNATLAQYQTALRSVTYENTNITTPSTALRQIDFLVNDWDDPSNTISRNINVIAVNTAPTLSGITGPTLSYTEGSGDVSAPFTVSITDADDTNMESATISITNNFFPGKMNLVLLMLEVLQVAGTPEQEYLPFQEQPVFPNMKQHWVILLMRT